MGVVFGVPSDAQFVLEKRIYAIHRTALATSINPDVVTHVAICEALVVLVGTFYAKFSAIFFVLTYQDMFLSLFELVAGDDRECYPTNLLQITLQLFGCCLLRRRCILAQNNRIVAFAVVE